MKILRLILFIFAALTMGACSLHTGADDTVARVDSVTLTQQELDARVKRVQDAVAQEQNANANSNSNATQSAPPPSADEIKRGVVGLFVQQNLVLSLARQRNISIGDQEINAEIERVRGQVEQGGQKLDTIVQSQLGLPSADSSEFRQFMSSLLAQDKLGATLVTTDTVRQELEAQIMPRTQQQVEKIDVAHILVKTEDEAKAVIDRLNKGEDFAALAKELSTDTGSKDNGGVYKGVQRGQFIPEFEKVAFDQLQPGEYTKTPVKSQYGYHVIKLISKTTGPAMTEEEAKQAVEQGLAQQVSQRQQQAVQDLVNQEKQKAKNEGRLVEPAYVEATAEPVQPQQGQPEGTPQPQQEQPAPTAQP